MTDQITALLMIAMIVAGTVMLRGLSLWHRHRWSKWETVTFAKAEYVNGGGEAYLLIQKRNCSACGKSQIERQVA